jgi:hypothetical protein
MVTDDENIQMKLDVSDSYVANLQETLEAAIKKNESYKSKMETMIEAVSYLFFSPF